MSNFADSLNFLKIKQPEVWFDNGVIVSKIIFLILLITLSFINVDISFLAKNPRNFLTESLLVGLFAAIPTFLMAYNRNGSKSIIISSVFITFLFFYLFNTLLELAGLNNYLNGVKEDDNNRRQQDNIKKIESQSWIWMIIGLVCIVMLYLAVIVHDFPESIIWKPLLIELAIFSVLNTIPQSVIAYNRHSDVVFASVASLIFYTVAYFILQSGGFFTHIFGNATVETDSSDSSDL